MKASGSRLKKWERGWKKRVELEEWRGALQSWRTEMFDH